MNIVLECPDDMRRLGEISELAVKVGARFRRPMTQTELQKHIFKTYFMLRVGLGALGFLFPLLLVLIGLWEKISIQGSMSDYYFATASPELRDFPDRVLFVGILFTLGCFLILYRGFNRTEDWMLNIAGVSALAIALFPERAPSNCNNCGSALIPYVHETAGVVLFVCTAFVAWRCSDATLRYLPDSQKRFFKWLYNGFAGVMFVTPFGVIAMTSIFGVSDWKILIVEWIVIWVFATYWLVKTVELKMDDSEIEKTLARLAKGNASSPA